jgi:protein involved in polysaccharide export with SLBB domain
MIKHFLFSIVILLLAVTTLVGQPPAINRAKILKTAQEKYGITPDNANITEAELIAELMKSGVDLSNEKAVEEAALEIIKAKQAKVNPSKIDKVNTKPTPRSGNGDAAQNQSELAKQPKIEIIEGAQKTIIEKKPKTTVTKVVVEDKQVKLIAAPPRVYGQDFPSSVSLQVDPKSINPKSTYIVGAGDEFSVSIYGQRSDDFKMVVNEDGYIGILDVPGSRIYVKGLNYGKAKKLIRGKIGTYYNLRASNLEISLVYARTVTVHIMGEVNTKGTQVISGVNTAFSALAASQGLTDIASVRNIKLIRAGEQERIIDIYKYMTDPSYGEDYYLQDNDYIIVPPLGKVVTVNGVVKRQGSYELIRGEGLAKLIEYAAGLQSNAYTENISIKRIRNNVSELINVNLQEVLDGKKSFDLLNGDIITVSPINDYNKDVIQVDGAFLYPGTYAFEEGKRIDYYLNKAQVKPEARTDTAYVIRKYVDGTVSYLKISIDQILKNPNSPDNVLLRKEDLIRVTAQSVDKYKVLLSGDVRGGEIELTYDSTLTIRDLVFLAGGLTETYLDKATIIRTSLETGEKKYIFFSLSSIMDGTSNVNSELALQPKDQILVFNESSIIDKFNISITGAVRTAKELAYDEKLTLKDLIYLSGGFTQKASNKLIISRVDLKTGKKEFQDVDLNVLYAPGSDLNNQIKLRPLDIVRVLPQLRNDQYSISIEGQVRVPGSFAWGEGLKLGEVLILSGGITPEATSSRVEISRININSNGGKTEVVIASFDIDANQQLVSGADFELEKYDQIIVRAAPEFELQKNVTIEGSIRFPGKYPLLGKKETLLSILNRSGGLTEEAFPIGAKLKRNEDGVGEVLLDLDDLLEKKERSVYNYILKAGDVIVIPKATDLIVLEGVVDNPKVRQIGKINIPFHKRKRALFYVNRYGQGVDRDDDARNKYIRVEYANGDVKETKNYGLFTITPKVKQGSTITVGVKPPKKREETEEGKTPAEPVDWGEVVTNALTQITGVLTLFILLQQVF